MISRTEPCNGYACSVNPVPNSNAWCLATGQDFLPNHVAPGIDYASFHMWSDNWGRTDVPFANGWLYAHMEDAATIGKPLVLEEFGKASAPFCEPPYSLRSALIDMLREKQSALRGMYLPGLGCLTSLQLPGAGHSSSPCYQLCSDNRPPDAAASTCSCLDPHFIFG